MSKDLSGLVAQANSLAGVDANGEPTTEVIQPTSNVAPDPKGEEKRTQALKLLEEVENQDVPTKIEPEGSKDELTPDDTTEIEKLRKEIEELKSKQAPDPLKGVEESVTKAGLDLTALEKTYVETGSLSKEQLESLAKAGFDEVAIDAYISMREQKAVESENKLLSSLGLNGREEYVEMAKWMAETLPKEECAVYDKGVEDPSLREYFIKTYLGKWKQATTEPETVTPERTITIRGRSVNTVSASSDTFSSIEDVASAMQDPRYKRDYKYRNEVLSKLQRSNY